VSACTGLVGPPRRYHSPKEHGHGKGGQEADKEEEEKVSGFSPQIGHKVDDQVEENSVGDLVRHVGKHRGKRLGRGVVKGITFVFLDDRTLCVERENLGTG